MTERLLPFSLFVLDSCLLALPLLLLRGNAAAPPGLLFLVSAIAAGILITGVLLKWAYNPLRTAGICLIVMSSLLFAGVSAILCILFALLSFQRLHARFSERQDEYDGNFLLLFLLVFPLSLFALIIWGEENRLIAFYAIAFFTLLFFAGSRLLYRYAATAAAISRQSFLKAASLLILLPAGGALSFYLIIDGIRVALGSAIGGILAFVLQPFEGLMENVLQFLEQAPLEPREAGEETESPGPPETATGEMTVYTPPFPYEWLAVPVIAAVIIALVLWLRKRQYRPAEMAPAEVPAEVSYGNAASGQQEQQQEAIEYSAVDLPLIREKFREFEREAAENGCGREEAETVREWFRRMNWPGPAAFFRTYDSVRYGGRTISEADAEAFLQEIEKIKKFFPNEV
ncbi:DUF4129 domain-containing protein [Planococcus lenghuensis]|uniref:Protein-glutamine gamma-glutamyltransferase-like C-terminal domain-containing protein n=1 Tax=Planococcus lenghuensis TaxID=2213202 RepID=A0A1Q2L095_9BACL|nr:DUF4129 domain-containing protein [Planococcus lenghuensis]AQQ53869.1 hypothetical protein B0X71_12725 [Planococcus lenghuensis]